MNARAAAPTANHPTRDESCGPGICARLIDKPAVIDQWQNDAAQPGGAVSPGGRRKKTLYRAGGLG